MKEEWEVAISGTSNPALDLHDTDGKFTFLDGRESSEEKRKIEPPHIEQGLYPSFVDVVVAMNK